MKRTLVLFLFSFLTVFCFSQNQKAETFRLELLKAGFSAVPQFGSVGGKSSVTMPLFVAMPLIFNKGIVTVPFYDLGNKSVGLFTSYDFFQTKKDSFTLSVYNVIGKNLTGRGGVFTFGLQMTPKNTSWVSPFLESGLVLNGDGTKTWGIFTGFFFTAAQVPIWKRKN